MPALFLGIALFVVVAVSAASALAHSRPQGWSRADLGAITQPAAVGGKFVFYAQHDGALEVVGVNASNGKTAWMGSASPSYVTAGVPAEVAVRDGVVFYLDSPTAENGGVVSIVARDAATGAGIWASQEGAFTSWPELCPDQPSAICVTGQVASGSGALRFSAATGKLIAKLTMGRTSRELGEGLFDPGSRHPEQLVAVSEGRVAWRLPLSRIFTLHHASTDGGWNFSRDPKLGVFIGSVGVEPDIKNGHFTVDLSQNMTAGFSLASGHVSWRTPGTFICGLVPCPGANDGSSSSPDTSSPTVGVRVIEAGTASGSVGGTATYSRNATLTIQGFNPVNGKTIWSFDAGHNVRAIGGGALPQIGQDSIVLRTGSSETALNLSTGATRHLRSTTRAWCERAITYKLKDAPYYGGKTGIYVGQPALYPCTVNAVAATIPASVPNFIGEQGASADGLTAWTARNAVYAKPNQRP